MRGQDRPAPLAGRVPAAQALTRRKGAGRYQSGRDRVVQIIDAALEIILEEGYPALTLREAARGCRVRIGAVSYACVSRADLLQAVFNRVLEPHAEACQAIEMAEGLAAKAKLERLIRHLLEDI